MITSHAVTELPILGKVTLVANGSAMTGLLFEHHEANPRVRLGDLVDLSEHSVLREASLELGQYLAGERFKFELILYTAGDMLYQVIWSIVQRIPYGETTTYEAIAQQLGNRALARQVGNALARNPLSVFIPCHRVVGTDGALTGYAGGVRVKRDLLELERRCDRSEMRTQTSGNR